MRRKSARRQPAGQERPSVWFQEVNGDHLFPLAHQQLENFRPGREDHVRVGDKIAPCCRSTAALTRSSHTYTTAPDISAAGGLAAICA
jgi:hypothetical protein